MNYTYLWGEANARILAAFAIKRCTVQLYTQGNSIYPGEARKTEITACTQTILTKLCGDWNV